MVNRNGKKRKTKFERSNSINVAVDGISIPQTEGKLHRHMRQGTDSTTPSTIPPPETSYHRLESDERRKLDYFLEKSIEKKSHKKIGSSPKFDDHTDVAVSADSLEPNENDQAEANVRCNSPGLQQRSHRLEERLRNGNLKKAAGHTFVQENRLDLSDDMDESVENEGLTRSLQRLEETLRSAKGQGCKFSPSSKFLGVSEHRDGPPLTAEKPFTFQSNSCQTTTSIPFPANMNRVVEANASLRTPMTQCYRESFSRDEQSSSTIRRLKRKGRRYKEVITVTASSKYKGAEDPQNIVRQNSQNGFIAMPKKEELVDSSLRTQPACNDHNEEKEIGSDPNCSLARSQAHAPQSSSLGKQDILVPDHLTSDGSKPLTSSGSMPTSNGLTTTQSNHDVDVKSNLQGRGVHSLRTNDSSSQTRLSKDMSVVWKSPAIRSTVLGFRSSRANSRNWKLSNVLSPNWLSKRSVEHEAVASLAVAASVQPKLPAHSQVPNAKNRNGNEVCSPKILNSAQAVDDLAGKVSPLDKTSNSHNFEKQDDRDDGTSLFHFPSADSAEKDLGDIFSFISSRKGSLNDGKATPANPPPADDELFVDTSRRESVKVERERSSAPAATVHTSVPCKKVVTKKKREKIFSLLSGARQGHDFGDTLVVPNHGDLDHPPQLPSKRRHQRRPQPHRPQPQLITSLKPNTNQAPKSQNHTPNRTSTSPTLKPGGRDAPSHYLAYPTHDLPSPIAVSEALTQSRSTESNNMFDLGGIISGLCGPSRKCQVLSEEDPPLAWGKCGGSRDEKTNKSPPEHSEDLTGARLPDVDNEGRDYLQPQVSSQNFIAPTNPSKHSMAKVSDEAESSIVPQASESIETVLHSQEKDPSRPLDFPSRVASLRGVLSSGNLSVSNGTVFNVRITLSKLKGLQARCFKTNPAHHANRPLVVGFARVEYNSSVATQSMDVAKSRPLDLHKFRERSAKLPPVVWGSKSVVDKRRGTLYFSVVLKQRNSDDGRTTFAPETVNIVVGLEYGEETKQMGTASLTINGTEIRGSRVSLPIQADAVQERKGRFFHSRSFRRIGTFHREGLSFGLEPESFLTARLDVKAGDPEASGPSVWDDYGGDDASFDESLNRSICEQPLLTEIHDSVEVVPLARGAAIITKQSNMERTESEPRRSSGSIETVSTGRWHGSKKYDEQTNHRRVFMPLFRSRKQETKNDLPRSSKAEVAKLHTPDEAFDEVGRCTVDDNVLSPISESHSECSLSDICSCDDESSDEESNSLLSRRKYNLTDKAADWVYRGAKAAGFFSYSSEEDKLTEFSFSKKDEVQMQTSDLSESEASDEASETLEGQFKFWIQTESLSSHEDHNSVNDTSLATDTGDSNASHTNQNRTARAPDIERNTSSLKQFKKILVLAQKLNVSPYELIKRIENGDTLENMQERK